MPTKIFAGNLPDGTSIKQITELFSVHGKVADANVIRNYAFVHFEDEEEAKKAVAELHKSDFSGRTIDVQLSKNQGSDAKGRRSKEDVEGRRDGRRDERRDRGRRSRSRDRSSRRDDRSRNRGGILGPNPLGALAGLSGLGGLGNFGAAPAFAPPIQPPVSRDPQHEQERPNPDVRVRREAVHVSHIPGAAAMGLMDGFVVYERYYVDPNHPLLKEPTRPRVEDTPVIEEQRVYDSFVAPRQETFTAPSRQQEDSYPAPSRQQQDSYSAPLSRQQDSYSAPAPSRQQEPAYPGYEQQQSIHDPYAALSAQAASNSYGRAAEDNKQRWL